MKLRFDVDQAACVRAGIDHPAPTAVIDVDPAQIKIDVRNLIADRLIGIDVCQLWNSDKGTNKSVDASGKPVHVLAEAPTFEALIKAVRKDEQIVQARQSCHRAIALARANSGGDPETVSPTTAPAQSVNPQAVSPSNAPAQRANPVPDAASAKKKPRKKRMKPAKAPKRKKII